MKIVPVPLKRKLTASILSGILLGLSVPNFSPVPLGFMAWFWLVPILFELKQINTFKSFFIQTLIAVSIGFSIITLWVVNASTGGFLASVLNGILVWMVPLIAFYFITLFYIKRCKAVQSLSISYTFISIGTFLNI